MQRKRNHGRLLARKRNPNGALRRRRAPPMTKVLLAAAVLFSFSACGVRGKPQPPLTPAELGRGQPTFKRATEEFAFPSVPSPEAQPDPTPDPMSSRGRRAKKPTGEGN